MQSRAFLSQLSVTGDESGFFLCLFAKVYLMILISNVLFINSVVCDDSVRLFVTISFGYL